jgi:hypothetical protein
MKKIFFIFLFLFYNEATQAATWQDPITTITWTYTADSPSAGKALVTGCGAGTSCNGVTVVEIPVTVGTGTTYTVDTLGQSLFKSKTAITAITFRSPSQVTTIENATSLNGCFRSCTALTELVLPQSLTYIGDRAVQNCANLASVTIGTAVTNIGNYAFNTSPKLTSISIPSTLATLGTFAFGTCAKLSSIDLSATSVTAIGTSAFSGNTLLATVNLPPALSTIGVSSFLNCTALTTMTFPATLTSIDNTAFSGCSKLYTLTFLGNMPTTGVNSFLGCKVGMTAYRPATATGWSNNFNVFFTADNKVPQGVTMPTPVESQVFGVRQAMTGFNIQSPTYLWEWIADACYLTPELGKLTGNEAKLVWKMWYNLFYGDSGIRYGESEDGVSWTIQATKVFPTETARQWPCVFKHSSKYYMLSGIGGGSATGNLDLHESTDGVTWTLKKSDVITHTDITFPSMETATTYEEDGILYVYVTNWGGTISGLLLYTCTMSGDASTWNFVAAENNPVIVQNVVGTLSYPNLYGPKSFCKLNGDYYMWAGGLGWDNYIVGQTGGYERGCNMYRWKSSSPTGPWTVQTINYPRTQNQGYGTTHGFDGPFSYHEYQGKTYRFTTWANLLQIIGMADSPYYIDGSELQISNLTMAQLVGTNELQMPSSGKIGWQLLPQIRKNQSTWGKG